ncbi:MAG TPA: formate dehydrogenase accessory sulfurtransferase FdhD [Rectinemataceae bacterium]|nr:formate dehydrogenase accessory sulfurtransferase FdhD [Rectinemataceae bacterium]
MDASRYMDVSSTSGIDSFPDSRNRLLAPEQAVAVEVNGKAVVTLMCSPYDLEVLALGHLFCGGYILSMDEVLSLWICPDNSRVNIKCTHDIAPASGNVVISSACGASPASSFQRDGRVRLPVGRLFPLARLRDWAREMFEQAKLYRMTGGMHCAALVLDDGQVFAFEDVGRHNAVDKAIGRGLREKADFSQSCLISSGRIAADMAAKAATAGIPVVVSRSIPTSAAFALAIDMGLTLVGRISSPSPIVYSMPERLI